MLYKITFCIEMSRNNDLELVKNSTITKNLSIYLENEYVVVSGEIDNYIFSHQITELGPNFLSLPRETKLKIRNMMIDVTDGQSSYCVRYTNTLIEKFGRGCIEKSCVMVKNGWYQDGDEKKHGLHHVEGSFLRTIYSSK